MKSEKPQNTKFKVLIIGTSGVGKSALLLKYIKNTFCYDYQVTTGAQFYSKTVKINEKHSINLQIWDTVLYALYQMGQQAFRAVVRSLYKGVSAILLVYSIDRKDSFTQLPDWFKQIQQSSHKETIIWLVGAKLDLQDIRQVSKIQAQQYGRSIQAAGVIEVSSKTGQNVKELFDKLSKYLYKRYHTSQAFRQLVQPPFQDSATKAQSFNLVNYRLSLKQSKQGCCS